MALNFKVRTCLNSKYLQIVSSCLGLAWFFFLLVHNRLQFVEIYSCSNYKQVQYKHYDLSYTPTEWVLTILGLRSCTVSLTLHLIIKRTNFLNLSSMSVSMSKRVFYIQSFWYPLSSRFDWNVFIVSSNNRLEYFILKSAFTPQLYSPRNDLDPKMIPNPEMITKIYPGMIPTRNDPDPDWSRPGMIPTRNDPDPEWSLFISTLTLKWSPTNF